MKTGTWKFSLLAILMVAALVVVGCGTPSPEKEIEQAVEATVEQAQTDVDTIFTDLGTAVNDALEKVGNLPSQQDAAGVITTDLQDIQSRLDDAIKSGDDDQLETFQGLGNGFDAVINNVNTAADAATGEQQTALKELSVVLVGAKKMLADSINTMLAAEGKATLIADEVEAVETEATTEAEAAEAAATAEAGEAEAAATAETEDVDAEATVETEEVDAEATVVGAEEEAVEAEETPVSSD